jgi:hypothetical protein
VEDAQLVTSAFAPASSEGAGYRSEHGGAIDALPPPE